MRVLIGTITKQRPKGLEALLASWASLTRPARVELHFAVVENEPRPAEGRSVTSAFKAGIPEPVHYALESQPGIPHARNRVLTLGREVGARYVLQCDDDQTVEPDWASRLLGAVREHEFHLAGGPNLFWSDDPGAPARYLVARSEARAATIARRAAEGREDAIDIYTNNWCADLPSLDAHGMRFDPALAFTGGSDTALSRAVRRAGGRIGWVPGAVTREELPARRCTYGFIYRRARDQVMNSHRFDDAPKRKNLPSRIPMRIVEAATVPLIGALRGRNDLPRAAHKLGRAVGTWRYLRGQESRHYAPEAAGDHLEAPARD